MVTSAVTGRAGGSIAKDSDEDSSATAAAKTFFRGSVEAEEVSEVA